MFSVRKVECVGVNTKISVFDSWRFQAIQHFISSNLASTCSLQHLQSEGENHVRLGQSVLVLLAHVDDGGVVSPFQLLEFELSSLGHGHALQVGHQLIHRGLELLDIHGLHFFRHKFGELATL